MAAKRVGLGVVGFVGGWGAFAYRYKPSPDLESPTEVAGQSGGGEGRRAPGHSLRREMDIRDGEPFDLLATRAISMATGMVVSRMVAGVANTTRIVDEGGTHHATWLAAVKERDAGLPLITVANHISVFDDPGMMGNIVPWDVIVDPKRMRWGICTQEICFKNAFLQAVMGSGQALPIKRGAGIQQALFLDVARHVSAGHWVHIFPEGRVIQSGMLGIDPLATRTKEEMEGPKGRLKWGVGRLVAHSLRCPVIIPMYHSGMDEVLPDRNVWVEDPETGKKRYDVTPKSFVPRKGKTIEVQFGAVVMVKDLVDAHEERHGLLQKVSWRPEDWEKDWAWWRSRPSEPERALYSAIAKRVEGALLQLEEESTQRRRKVYSFKRSISGAKSG